MIGIGRTSRRTASAGRKAAWRKLVVRKPRRAGRQQRHDHRQHGRGGGRAEVGHQAATPRRPGVHRADTYYYLLSSHNGWRLALWFSVVLNVNLALLNMLPIPVLDGGHILLALIEAVRRKPVNIRLLEVIQTACFLLIAGYMLYVSFYDVGDLAFGRNKPATTNWSFPSPTPAGWRRNKAPAQADGEHPFRQRRVPCAEVFSCQTLPGLTVKCRLSFLMPLPP